MHEYCHLIQDVTTCYGYLNFIYLRDKLQDIHWLISQRPTIELITVPLQKYPGASKLWHTELDIIQGHIDVRSNWEKSIWAFEQFRIEKRSGIDILIGIFIDNLTDREYEHPISVREIKEAYTIAIEEIYSSSKFEYSQIGEFQYIAIERILTKLFAGVNNLHIVTICHWALQHPNPSLYFRTIINLIQNQYGNVLPNEINLYKYLQEKFLESYSWMISQIINDFDRITCIQGQISHDDLLYQTYNWYIKNILVHIHKLSDTSNCFPIDTQFCMKSDNIAELLKKYPIYSLETFNDACFTYENNGDSYKYVYFIRSMYHLSQMLWTNNNTAWSCVWYDTCELKMKNVTCKEKPWVQTSVNFFCPYKAASKYFEFDKITQIISKP
jgi:hypothetical protein